VLVHRSTHTLGVISIVATVGLVAFFALLIATPEADRSKLLGVTPPPTCTYRASGALPDPKCTPGATYHAVTQATINKTICVKGWTATIRPPLAWTEPHKFKSMRAYGVDTSPGHAQLYEYDHLIPLELGGAPADERNLWPEPHAAGASGSFVKDGVENKLRAEVCAGRMKLAAARRLIRTDWTKAITP
jgi:hypothetical protein